MPNFVSGCGSASSKLMICGEAPGEIEDRIGIPFNPDAPSGRLLTSILQELGINRSDVYITNVFKYRPPENNIKNISLDCNEEEQINLLWKEVSTLQPYCILPLGGTALKTFTGKIGVAKYRGSILKALRGDTKVVGSYHPASILNPRGRDGVGEQWKHILKLDIKRALE